MTDVQQASELPKAQRVTVSVIIPMRDEAAHIENIVHDLAAQDFAEHFEVIVADGGSTDGSVELLRTAADTSGLDVTVVENPDGHASPGLNRCIQAASGEFIVRLDCHTRYPRDYVRRCVVGLRETGAANIGGVFTAIGRTPTERAIACAFDSPFGGHNWTRNLNKGRRVEVDTNYLGAFRRAALERVGAFDEDLVVGEVEDLNLSLRQAGETVLLDPEIRSYYYPRGSFPALFRQYYRYGYWKVAVMRKHGQVISGRSLVPCVFVGSLAGLGLAAVVSGPARKLLGAELALYALGAVSFGAAAMRRRRETATLLPLVVATFPILHVAHGSGTVHGTLDSLLRRPSTI
jgi:succinoglycan biosynthesis protein ExoA